MPKHLIFFDGECAFCNQRVHHLLEWDHSEKFLFAPLEGSTAKKELHRSLEKLQKENTLVLLENYASDQQRMWIRGRGVLRIFWLLGGKWKLLGWLSFLPCGADLIYRLIAHHRHLLAGKKTPATKSLTKDRFLP